MADFTLEQQREILSFIESCSKDWEFVVKTNEIRRAQKTGWRGWLDMVWRRKQKVEALYRWIQNQLATEEYCVLPRIIERDGIPVRGKYPRVYKLLGDWTIPGKDLRTLTHGPLFDTNGNELVKPGGKIGYWWNRFWPPFTVVATIIGFVTGIIALAQYFGG